jgi:hypothetical protein
VNSITIPGSLSSIGDLAFASCTNLSRVNAQGNAPVLEGSSAFIDTEATLYRLPGTLGWESTFGGRPTAFWSLPYPVILKDSSSFGAKPGGFGFRISWVANAPVVVEAALDPAAPEWLPVSTNVLTGGVASFADPDSSMHPARFYRLRSP